MKVEGTWPSSLGTGNYSLLVHGVEKHFASCLKRVRLKLLKGEFDFTMEIGPRGKYIDLKVNLDNPLLPQVFSGGYLDCMLYHESKHLDLSHDWKMYSLMPADVVDPSKKSNEYWGVANFQTYLLDNEITEIFAVSRMSDNPKKKYVEWLNYEIQYSLERFIEQLEKTPRFPKAVWILIMARQEFFVTKTGSAFPDRFFERKTLIAPNSDDQLFYSEVMKLYEVVWQQANSDPPKLSVEDQTKKLCSTLFYQKEPFIKQPSRENALSL